MTEIGLNLRAKLIKNRDKPYKIELSFMIFLLKRLGKLLTALLVICCLGSGAQAMPGVMQTKLRRIVIDPGHGGGAAGAVGHNGTREKDVVLNVAMLLGKLIEEQLPDVKVFYTRTSDVDVDLAQRGKLANQHKADLFLSIHANSNKSRSESASGTETYVMGLDKSDNNLAVARRENAAILNESDYSSKYEGYDPNSPESFILFSLLQNSYLDQSITLASMIEDQYVKTKRKSRGVKQGPFLVLWRTGMPSLLTEIGFISNPYEEEYMTSYRGQFEIATDILTAIKNYKKMIEGNSFLTNVSENKKETKSEPKYEPKADPKEVSTEAVSEPKKATSSTKEEPRVEPKESSKKESPKVESITSMEGKACFGIQLCSSPKILNTQTTFPGISDVSYVKKGGLYKYYVGCYPTRQDAQENLARVRQRISGAFVIEVSPASGSDK